MKYIKNIILLVSMITCLSSCDMLNIEPESSIPESNYYKSIQDIEYATNAIYACFASTDIYGQDYYTVHAGHSDLEFFASYTSDESPAGFTHTVSNPQVRRFWRQLYICVNRANEVIDGIDRSPIRWESKAIQYHAEASFLRAHAYFLLAQFFGDVPMRITSYIDPSEVNLKSTPIKKVMEWVYNEMENSISGLPDAKQYSDASRINKSVVRAMLARISLFMAGATIENDDDTKQLYYANALKWAKSVNGTSDGREGQNAPHSLKKDYKDLFIDLAQDKYDISCRENIWEIQYNGNGIGHNNPGQIGVTVGVTCDDASATGKGFSEGFYRGYLTLHDLYNTDKLSNNEIDLRYSWNLANYSYRLIGGELQTVMHKNLWDYTIAKFRREYEIQFPRQKRQTSINFPVIRYADVLLMIAEAENELYTGSKTNALACINDVRVRAGLSPLPLNTSYLKKLIENERGREFIGEGIRHMDLLRWGKLVSAMNATARITFTDSRYGSTGASDNLSRAGFLCSEKNKLYPIPQAELNINKLVKQNIGW